MSGPTTNEIRKVSKKAISIFARQGLNACLFGSAACFLYGMDHRDPNDIDLIVLTRRDPEELKEILASSHDKFYLVPAQNPLDDWKVLWYSLPSKRSGPERRCKVDILIPGLLSIPRMTASARVFLDEEEGLPLVPLMVLILLKLRGWDDHMNDDRQRMQDKVEQDEEDIQELLELAGRRGYNIHLDDEDLDWLPQWFIDEAFDRVGDFIQAVRRTRKAWIDLGFNI